MMKRQISEIEREIVERNGKLQPSLNAGCLPEGADDTVISPKHCSPDLDLHTLDPLRNYYLLYVAFIT